MRKETIRLSGSDGPTAEDHRTTVLVSALRLTLGLATLPLLSLAVLVARGERALQRAPEPVRTDPKTPARTVGESSADTASTDQADSAALPARADVEAALRVLTTATLPRAGRRGSPRETRVPINAAEG